MHTIIFFAGLFLFLAASAAPIYKTEDEFGRPIFSDSADETAEEVELGETITYESKKLPRFTPAQPPEEPKPERTYSTIEITNPVNDSAVRDNSGSLELTFEVIPDLHPSHTLQLLMDGTLHQTLSGSGATALENLDRGTHVFQLRIVNRATDKVVDTGPPASITMLRHAIKR